MLCCVSAGREVYEPCGQSEYSFRRSIAFVRLCLLQHVRVGVERYAQPALAGSYTRVCVHLSKFVLYARARARRDAHVKLS